MKRLENSSPSTDELGAPKFAAANVDKINVTDVEQLVSEVPTGTKVSTVPAQMKPTLKSKRRTLNRGTVFASHWLNTPLKDGEMYVSAAYQIIKTMAANYQRTHQDSFFEAWPGCLILEKTEEVPETNLIRANFEDYSERLAHYAWHYYNAKCMLNGALANLLVLSRLNGNTALKDIAADCRWSRVNTYTNMFSRFPDPVGLLDFIASNTAFAIGKTSYGADILSIPMWIVDIYGNRSSHALLPDEVISNFGGLGAEFITANLNNPNGDGLMANRLLENIVGSMVEYGSDPSNVDDNTYHPRMPHLENGGVIVAQDAEYEFAIKLNVDGIKEYYNCPDPVITHNQVSATAWNNYMYWQDYMIRNFPEMLDPNSDIYVFFTTQLKLFDSKTKKVKEVLDIIHSLKNVDMLSLRESMKYKRNNPVTTATVLKWMPLCGGSKGRDMARTNSEEESCFDRNFHRYTTHGMGTAEMIHENSKWPRLTPTSFLKCVDGEMSGDKANVPFVFNVGPTVGSEILPLDPRDTDDELPEAACQVPVGKFGYLLDLASTRLADPEHGHISGFGITEEAMKDFIDHANGIVFDEDSSNVRIFSQPMIDNTDPCQCGFNIMVSDQILTPNEVQSYTDPDSYGDEADPEVGLQNLSGGVKITLEPAIADSTSSTKYSMIHASNEAYRTLMRYMFIFVGDGIFDQPYQNLSSILSAIPTYQISMSNYRNTVLTPFAAKWTDPQSAVDPANGYESIALSVTGAGYVGSSEQSTPVSEASAAILDIMRRYDKNSNSVDMMIAMFNPQYGPVKIVAATATEIAGKMPQSMWKEQPYLPTQVGLKPALVLKSHLWNLSKGFVDLKRNICWDSVKYAARYWLEFLSEFQFNPSSFDNGYKTFITPYAEPFDSIIITDEGHSYRTFLANINAQFCGCNKYNPFWSADNISESKMKSLPPSIATTMVMPENDVMAEPRVPRSVKSPDRNYSDVKATTTGWKTQARESERSIFDGSKSSKGKESKSGKKSYKAHNRDHNSMNSDGIQKESPLVIKEGSGFDDSSLKDERISNGYAKAGKKMTGADLDQSR